MNEFELSAPGHDIEVVQAIPNRFHSLLLKGAEATYCHASFGDLVFNHYAGDGFDIWKSHYLIEREAVVSGKSNKPVLEFTVMYENGFSIDWKDVVTTNLPYKLIEMYYAPYVENTAMFRGDQQLSTIDFHYHQSLLDEYSGDFPLLDQFMNKVRNNKAARLFDGKLLSSPAMDIAIKEMIAFSFRDALAARYYDSYAHIVLILLLERISNFNPLARHYSDRDKERAVEAKRLLTIDFEKSYSIKQLCKLLQTNPYKLKTTFKYLFGTSIGKYKKSVLMQEARILLETTTLSLDDISYRLGYSSQQSFSTAFRNYFKNVPSHFRKKY